MQTRAEKMAEHLKTWSPTGVVEHRLGPREKMKRILELRYLEGKTLEEVGQLLGVTRERVRQIEAKAIRILRANSENRQKALDALAGVEQLG